MGEPAQRAALDAPTTPADHLPPTVSSADCSQLARELIHMLSQRAHTVATAESLTGGLIGAAITSVPGASAVYRGGIISYATELKSDLAGVPGTILARHGAVSEQTAAAMARGVATRCGADWGIAVTGVAGPDKQEGKPAGTVYCAVSCPPGTASVADRAGPRVVPSGIRKERDSPSDIADDPEAGEMENTTKIAEPAQKNETATGPCWVRRFGFEGDRRQVRAATVRAALGLAARLGGR